jgi:hypothetical protein
MNTAKRKAQKKKIPARRRERALTMTGEDLNRLRNALGFAECTAATPNEVAVRVETLKSSLAEAADRELDGPMRGLVVAP